MRRNKEKSFFKRVVCAGLLAIPFFAGCSDDESSTGPSSFSTEDYLTSKVSKVAYQELLMAHSFLDIYYYDAHLKGELDPNVKVYLDYSADFIPQNEGGLCTAEFASVCYMFSQMSDKFTRYFDPYYAIQVYGSYTQTQSIIGIGAEVEEIQDSTGSHLIVTDVYENSPSEFSKLALGDQIISIDGNIPTNKTGFDKLTLGNKGDTLTIVVRRDGEEKTIPIILDQYEEPSVHLSYKDSIPIIKIDEFMPISSNENGTYGEFQKYLKKVNASGARSLVVDLRSNPGGEETQCSNIASEFLSEGDTIFNRIATNVDSSKNKTGMVYMQKFDTLTTVASNDGLAKDLYTVFLVNENTASCAEVMLSAVTINRMTPVVGTTTYGKGIGQILIPPDGEATFGLSVITRAHVEDKNHKTYHAYGIAPDYELADPDEQLEKALELARNAKEKRSKGYGKTPTGNFKRSSYISQEKNPDLGFYTILK